jgi:hypothetical protein
MYMQACLPLMEDIMQKLDKKHGRHGRELARFLVLFAQVKIQYSPRTTNPSRH